MKQLKETTRMRKLLAFAVCGVLAFGVAACGDDSSDDSSSGSGGGSSDTSNLSGEIAGAGASSQEAAMEAWIAGFQEPNPDVTIAYDPVGSGGGREQFVAGGTAFAGSDAALEGDELSGAAKRCGGENQLVQVPDYVSPIAVIYNLEGVDSLQLSPETLAKIFKQEIKNWNDPAIKADNPDADLPDERITPVNRSDESGTTENFTDYLSKTAGNVWTFDVSGDWPVKGGEAAQGTSGVVEAVGAGNGTIGYADESQAGDLSIAKIKVGEAYVAPSAEAAAKVLEESSENKELSKGQYVFAYDLKRDTTSDGTYPVVLVSYLIGCTKYDKADEGAIVKGFFNYIISPEGQDAAAKNAGSAPLSDAQRQKIQPAVDAIQG
jgi:phosphate transport system substrate-binding protein